MLLLSEFNFSKTLFVESGKLLAPVHQSLELLGSLTTPLSLIFIGSMLGDMETNIIFKDLKVFLYSTQRLILLPLSTFGLSKFFGFCGFLINIPVLYSAMPVAAMTPILAAKFGNDYYLASKLIFVSTALGLLVRFPGR